MSGITVNIGTVHIVYQQSPAKLTSEQQQQAYAESVEADKEAQEEVQAVLEAADFVHSTGYPDDLITQKTPAEKAAYIRQVMQAVVDRQAERRERLKNK